MDVKRFGLRALVLIAVATSALAVITAANADHWWGGYKWAGSGKINLRLRTQVTSQWSSYLTTARNDWDGASVGTFGYPDHIDFTTVSGSTSSTTRRLCRAGLGEIRVCNSTYGNNGWLGIAQIWIYSDGTIAQAIVKLNDTYFGTSAYNTPAWRRLVMCQEIAHGFGLDHQDEAFYNGNLGSCMDYTADPDGPPSNEHPNSHDFAQIDIIYGGGSQAAQGSTTNGNGAAHRSSVADQVLSDLPPGASPENGTRYVSELGGGQRLITHVYWVPDRVPANR